MKISDELIAVRDLIKDPKHWCKGHMAKTWFLGWDVDPNSYWAYKWCLTGAFEKVAGRERFWSYGKALLRSLTSTSLVGVNDAQGHDAVMELLNRGIELALAQEKKEEENGGE